MDEWEKQEKELQRQEANRKAKEKRQRQKEQLAVPIHIPNSGEKGEYEKLRDKTILERCKAMKESGMFSDSELQAMYDMIK